ncbi:leucine zipper protein 2-like isoform X3 [Stegostoma tigrinum]|uniref:leucine zipper protein 2-like isoform X3 n=1 Tax=Stegostoma tigrinum TaxID=3053191 RepID=UPI00202B4C7F|nr:leucine zipper protein 2-like isoform X3 [Stegostoma tigrinum]
MKLFFAGYFLLLFPAAALSTRHSYEELERKLKQISSEKSSLLQQLSKSATELQGMKGNLQILKTDEAVAKNDVQKLLEINQKQTDEMKSLQETLQKQINEAAVKAEKQQAGINFLKAEVERKSKLIRDLQQENKSLKNKLLSGSKQCGIHAEQSKRIQSQLKELRYGKKDLIFKAQQLTDLERKLLAAKQALEKTAGDKIPDTSQIENTGSPRKGMFPNVTTNSSDQDLVDCSSHNGNTYESSRLRSRSQKPEQNEKKIRDCGY